VNDENKRQPTQRAVDSRESARFSGIFLALADSRFQALSTPALLPLTQAVGQLKGYKKLRQNNKG
jgi:hypothetical protein